MDAGEVYDLSDAELRARLEQRDVDPAMIDFYMSFRDEPHVLVLVVEALG